MTTPSNACARSFSPSLMRTDTLTVSPTLKSGRFLVRSCFFSRASIIGTTSLIFDSFVVPAKGALVFTISIQPVKNNRTRRTHAQVIVVANPANRREAHVTAGEELVGQAPAGAENEQRGALAALGREVAKRDRRGGAVAGGCGADD